MIKKLSRKILAVALSALMLGASCPAFAFSADDLQTKVNETAAYVAKTVSKPQVGSIGGEWAALGLARSGCEVDKSFYQSYYSAVEDYVKERKGVLHDRKYTEYSRVILALTAIGKDPSNVAGFDLLIPLGDFDKTVWQGINGPVFALIALDSGGYSMPKNQEAQTQATRKMYVDKILSRQLKDGGFAMGDTSAEPDITAMALQALAKYQDEPAVKTAVDKALNCLSKMQNSLGGFNSLDGSASSESVSQAITALGELGIELDDSRFVKNGKTLLDNLLGYYVKGGGFKHTAENKSPNQMATEQALYALVSAKRSLSGQKSLYNMSDAVSVIDGTKKNDTLAGKNADVKVKEVIYPDKSFTDLSDINPHKNQEAIIALAKREIIGGYEDGSFCPDGLMTRAEFAAITVKALGLVPKTRGVFSDVEASSWYAPYIDTANAYGIVNGTSQYNFEPEGTITREQAAVMVTRAARLCGLVTSLGSGATRDTLAQFDDYLLLSDWAQESMAFCFSFGILDQSALEIRPSEYITRGEIAEMLYKMLGKANLL